MIETRTSKQKKILSHNRYVRILGSNQEVVRVLWLIKYISPSLVTACSQPSGNGPNDPNEFAAFVIEFTASRKRKKTINKGISLLINFDKNCMKYMPFCHYVPQTNQLK